MAAVSTTFDNEDEDDEDNVHPGHVIFVQQLQQTMQRQA